MTVTDSHTDKQPLDKLSGLVERVTFHRNSRRKPPNSFGWRNAALIHTRKRPCARDAHFATLC